MTFVSKTGDNCRALLWFSGYYCSSY